MNTATYNFIDYAQPPSIPVATCRCYSTTDWLEATEWKSAVEGAIARKISSFLSSLRVFQPVAADEASTVQVDLIDESVSQSQVAELIKLQRELIGYLYLPRDWDGYGGQHARPRAMFDALEFLQRFPRNFPIPKPMLSGSGVVGLYWDRESHYASLEFEGDGTYTYLTDSQAGYGGEEGVAAAAFPSNLRHFLTAILPVIE